jgi:ABC-type transport system involved in cytochrome c biogenesis permease subunit
MVAIFIEMNLLSTSALQHAAALTFGRDMAHFKQLITFLAILSVILWGIVAFTTITRMLASFFYRQRKLSPIEEEKSS